MITPCMMTYLLDRAKNVTANVCKRVEERLRKTDEFRGKKGLRVYFDFPEPFVPGSYTITVFWDPEEDDHGLQWADRNGVSLLCDLGIELTAEQERSLALHCFRELQEMAEMEIGCMEYVVAHPRPKTDIERLKAKIDSLWPRLEEINAAVDSIFGFLGG